MFDGLGANYIIKMLEDKLSSAQGDHNIIIQVLLVIDCRHCISLSILQLDRRLTRLISLNLKNCSILSKCS